MPGLNKNVLNTLQILSNLIFWLTYYYIFGEEETEAQSG